MDFVIILVVLGLIGGGVYWFLHNKSESPPQEPPATVDQSSEAEAKNTEALPKAEHIEPVSSDKPPTSTAEIKPAEPIATHDFGKPPGTKNLDEETAERPEVDPNALAAARSKVSDDIPDELLSDALLDASPQEVAKMFDNLSSDIMGNAISAKQGIHIEGEAKAEDLASLDGLGDSLDSLDIWDDLEAETDTVKESKKKA